MQAVQAVSKQCNCKSSYQDALNSLSSHSITSSTFVRFATSCAVYSATSASSSTSSFASCHLCSVAHQVFISHSPFSIEETVEEAEQRDKNLNYFVATWLPLRGSLITSVSLSLIVSPSLLFSLFACHCFTLIFAHNDLICFSIGVAIEALDAWLPSDFLGRPSRRPENALTHTHRHRHPVCVWVGVFAFSSADIVCQLDIRHIIN